MTTRRISTLAVIVATAFSLSFCKKEHSLAIVSDSNEVPVLNGNEDYPVSTNDHLATLGKVLFYDKELSLNKNISCGSCHQQQHAFTDNLQFSPGTDNLHTSRNTPSIFAKNGRLFWDGRSNSLPDLALRPVQNDVEMNIQNVDHLVQRIASLDYYSFLFQNAFPRALKIDSNMIKTAIAEFLRNFDFSNNKFHRSEKGLEKLNPS
jgi:cytochrome c peroxidase